MRLLLCTKALIPKVRSLQAGCLSVGLALTPAVAAGGPAIPPVGGSLTACLEAVADPKGDEISCDYAALLTEEERADMQRLSRGLLQDARCLIRVSIARSLVDPALMAADHVFQAPPQPVTCSIKTKDGGFPVEGTFAPKVTFKGGMAVDGTPGLGNVTGINRYLAWPIVQYVNRSPSIKSSMLEMINVYRARLQKSRKG